jgi:hypothetical protein
MASPHEERWFFSASNLKNVEQLKLKLELVDLARSNTELTRKDKVFQPWMSSRIFRKRFKDFLNQSFSLVSNANEMNSRNYARLMLEDKTSGNKIFFLEEKDKPLIEVLTTKEPSLVASEKLVSDAQITLRSVNSNWNALHSLLCKFVVPSVSKNSPQDKGYFGLSTRLCRGVILLDSSRHSASNFAKEELCISLAHELGHQSLFVLQAYDSLVSSEVRVHSVLRKSERPAIVYKNSLQESIAIFQNQIEKIECTQVGKSLLNFWAQSVKED